MRLLPNISIVLFVWLHSVQGSATDLSQVDFNRDVRPILSESCFSCHGQDPKHREGGLRLDDPKAASSPLKSGRTAIQPGKPSQSELLVRITSTDPTLQMPPPEAHRPLSTASKEVLKKWIEQGAKYASHWAFAPPRRATLPLDGPSPVDSFILARLRSRNLPTTPPAPPSTWLRRAALDLTGRAPSPRELDAFERAVEQRGESAYVEAVDRFLASPAFGERMAIDWLDVSRYADTHGFNNDSAREMWRWRDWVIDAFNSGLPYDQFIIQQIAGDLLPNASLEQRIATGFARNHVINSEGGIIDEEYRVEYVADRVRTLSAAWLGLSMECARCHNHKYDPITQKDYYGLFAFFNNVPENGEDGRVANASPLLQAPTSLQQSELQRLQHSIALARQNLATLSSKTSPHTPVDARSQREVLQLGVLAGKLLGMPEATHISCDDLQPIKTVLSLASDTPASMVSGVKNQAWSSRGLRPIATLEPKVLSVGRKTGGTAALWIKPHSLASNTPTAPEQIIFSSMDYASAPAGGEYGVGQELRLVQSELELRLCRRFPAYSLIVRTEGAKIPATDWSHVAVVHQGSLRASGIRFFINGREVPTRFLADGLSDAPPDRAGAIGGPASGKEPAFWQGEIDEIHFFPRPLDSHEIKALHHVENRRSNELLLAQDPRVQKAREDLEILEEKALALQRSFPTTMVMAERETPRETHVLSRGRYDAPNDRVTPAALENLLTPWPTGAPRNRLGLARWLTQPDHPLVARVVVNRFWAHLFGIGLVKTTEDFGVQGEPPTHPELLDWLAREFIDSGWNVKALYRRLVLSDAYRRDSAAPSVSWTHDPENRLISRGPRFRLPAEIVRDHALSISGLLRDHVGGPSVYPTQPEGLYDGLVVGASYPGTQWVNSTGDQAHRRSVYTFWKRTIPYPTFTTFDAPDREFCTARRGRTNTPLQALALLNDPVFLEAALALADRSQEETAPPPLPNERAPWMFHAATGRRPSPSESATLLRQLAAFQHYYSSQPEQSTAWLKSVGANVASPDPDRAAWVALANLILNLDASVTKE